MPPIKLQHVVSVSSEDKNFPAENLLKNDSFKKWKCGAGEKSAAITLQFEKASEINQIDIGNEGSAFIEVLVGKSSSSDDSYQVILMSSSFMNPVESRNSQNLNRVRIFDANALSKAALGQKWDRVRVVCTQPFAKGTQYGLSFIKLYSTPTNEDSENEKRSPSKQLTLGAFMIKSDTAGDSIKAGSLFEKNKQKNEEPTLTGAAAIRAASRAADAAVTELASTSDHAKESKSVPSSVTSKIVTDQQKHEDVKQSIKDVTVDTKAKVKREAEENTSKRSQSPPAKKAKMEPIATSSSSQEKPFNKLMDKVKFVISGFQNPLRGQLRDKAQEMGGTYKAEWGAGCTHLICAFENTPKYNEVKGKGRIVKKEWLIDCHKQKKLLPWRQYRLGRAQSPTSDDSGDEASSKREKNRKLGKQAAKAEPPCAKPEKEKKESQERKQDTKKKKVPTATLR